eukprot:3123383-Heterocapsa_arctica.AAC.1
MPSSPPCLDGSCHDDVVDGDLPGPQHDASELPDLLGVDHSLLDVEDLGFAQNYIHRGSVNHL